MGRLSDDQIREIDDAVHILETLDLNLETPDSVNDRMINLERLFYEHGITGNSGFYKRYKKFFLYARWHFYLKDEAPQLDAAEFRKPRGPYKGLGMRLNLAHFYFYLLRTYYTPDHKQGSPTIRLIWRISAAGQIQSLEASTSMEEKPLKILTLDNFEDLEPGWTEATAIYRPLPDAVRIIEQHIKGYEKSQQYRRLINEGHRNLGRILNYISKGKTNRNPTRPNVQPLHLILQDPVTQWMIENGSKQNAILKPEQDKLFSIYYTRRR